MKGKIEFETFHPDEETAELVARSVSPDNTDDIDTRVEDEKVRTTIEREGLGSVTTTADDYLKNLMIAVDVADISSEDEEPGEKRKE